jgi:hypothetical protein
MSNQANIPDIGAPFLMPNGSISPVWWGFLIALFNRTGATQGVPPTSADGSDSLIEAASTVDVQYAKKSTEEGLAPVQVSKLARRIADLEAQAEGLIPIPPVGGTVFVRG